MVKKVHKRKKRLTAAFILVSLIFFGLTTRLLYIQVINAEKYQTLATMQRTRDIPIPAVRGDIFDRNGIKLAFSIKTFSIWVRPSEITDLNLVLEGIENVVPIDEEEVTEKIIGSDGIVNIRRGLSKEEADQVLAYQYKGVWVTDDIQRVYPFDNFASHVIGHTTTDNVGIAGVEQSLNDVLTGVPGKYLISTDASGRQLAFGTDREFAPIDGYDVVLTVDQVIQHYLEKALEEAYADHLPVKVMGIVMNTKTGEILAMSSKPDYNLNEPRIPSEAYGAVDFENLTDQEKVAFWSKMWRNPVVSSLYEPGSIFKVITASAGLEENVVTPYTKFDAHGYLIVDGVKIKCWSYRNPHGEQTLTEGLENSCNPVFMETETLLGKEAFYDYVTHFGFTEKTGIQLPAEAGSLLIPRSTLNNVEAATMSFGHGISITPLQLIRAIGAIANDGVMMQPYIVDSILDQSGQPVDQFGPQEIRQVISEKTSIEMRLMMESVVDNGSGANAQIQGIRLGGKTGTSEKIVNGEYSGDKAYASFSAIGPIEDPEIAILIVVDEPKFSTYGSVVAAPVARKVLVDTFRYLGINPVSDSEAEIIQVPDFTGLSQEKAENVAKAEGLIVSFTDNTDVGDTTIVVKQYPKAGKMVEDGSLVILKMDRWEEE
jgi:stage V sporulation protein D (sporulation-specific penicillin-binding protein)